MSDEVDGMGESESGQDMSQFLSLHGEIIGLVSYFFICFLTYYNRITTEGRLLQRLDENHDESWFQKSGFQSSTTMGKKKKAPKRGLWKTTLTIVQDVIALLAKPLHFLLERQLHFYKELSREEVEYLLWREGNTDGSYIISEILSKSKEPASYNLWVCLNKKVDQYEIKYYEKDMYGIDGGRRYPDLYELVNHYHREAGELKCRLVRNSWRKDGDELLAHRPNGHRPVRK
eukprot:m.99187 g.99187  ORF g.99187 m.99187 type:complete len:231 (-) comp13670_c0_seq2:39-731(-)